MQIHLHVHPRYARYRHPVGHRMPVQVVLQQCERDDQRHHPLPVVLDEAQELPTDQRQALSSLDR
jgi:hypothetical protein